MSTNFFLNLEKISFEDYTIVMETDICKSLSKICLEITNEVKPIDLYCYLYAKFGPPNGLATLMNDCFDYQGSNNLIHWDWCLSVPETNTLVLIQGHNSRTEVHVIGDSVEEKIDNQLFKTQIQSDFRRYGKKKSEIKNKIDKWNRFVNPFFRVRASVEQLLGQLEKLNVDIEKERFKQPCTQQEILDMKETWETTKSKYDLAIGITFGLRALLPILAESTINLLLFAFCKPAINSDNALFESKFREQIHTRVASLNDSCNGFKKPVDSNSNEFKKFHTLMNQRNDLLHGNINPSKLKISDVYFDSGRLIFEEYEDLWEKSIGIFLNSINFNEIKNDYRSVKQFIIYLTNLLEDPVKEKFCRLLLASELSQNASGDLEVLFSEELFDFRGFD